MKYLRQSLFILTFALLAGACGQSDEQPAAEAPTEPAADEVHRVIVTHPVSDVAVWKDHFEEGAEARAEYGLTEVYVAENLDESGVMTVVLETEELERANEFLGMEDFEESVAEMDATAPPEVATTRLVRTGPAPAETAGMLSVSHEVEDFDAWVAAFDDHASAREEAGLHLAALSRGVENDNMVYVDFYVTDLDAAEAFIESPELAQVMMDAGVVGEPDTRILRIVE